MLSKCPHCNNLSWELVTEEPRGSAFKVNFIRCTNCKAPIGVLPFYDVHSNLKTIEKEVKSLGSSNSTIASILQVIDQNIRKLFLK